MRKSNESAPLAKASVCIDNADFVLRCVRGDKEERERLARACLPEVRKIVVFGYGNKPDMEDVAQKALVTIFQDLKNLRNPASFRVWMYRITCHVIYRHGSYRNKLRSLFIVDEMMDSRPSLRGDTPESTIIRQQALARVSKHLEKIKHKKRMAVVLSMFMGHVDSEIGVIMGCSTETAKKRIQTGKRELLNAIRKDKSLRGIIEEVVG